MLSSCKLCNQAIHSSSLSDEEGEYCCHGCQAVYHILKSQGRLKNAYDEPLFLQAAKHGVISNPEVLKCLQGKSNETDLKKNKEYFEIEDLWCPSCADVICLVLKLKEGIVSCRVDFSTDLGVVEYFPQKISKERIYEIISGLGYTIKPLEAEGKRTVQKGLVLRLSIAAFCSLNVMMFSYPVYATYFSNDAASYGHLFAWIAFFASLPSVTYCAWPIYRRGWNAFLVGIVGMEALVSLGVLSAFLLSFIHLIQGGVHIYFDSMSVIIAFVLLGKLLESQAKYSAKESLLQITRSLPKRGRKLLPDGSQVYVPIKEIQKGDLFGINTGEKVVLDGMIVEGEALVDESVMTGESYPLRKKMGDGVIAGSLVNAGTIVAKASASLEASSLHKIVDMLNDERSHKRGFRKAVDTVSQWFVPVVIGLALGIFLWDISSYSALKAISVVLIACPCAIGIAVPLAESYLLHGMGSLGAVIRNREVLAFLGKESVCVFDKTGTITQGKFQVISGLESLSKEHLSILKGMAQNSNHPISQAIARSIHLPPVTLDRTQEILGKGIIGTWQSKEYALGSDSLINGQTMKKSEATQALFYVEGKWAATILLEDSLRDNVKETLDGLKPAETILLSGDHQRAVERIATLCGFKKCFWEQSPMHKRDFIQQLTKKKVVCMVGDGVNDAPALSAAHVGISAVSATDISIHTSDILLTTDHLGVLPKIRHLAVKGRRVIKQNLFWAFSYNVIGIFLALSGYLSPLYSAFAMVFSSVIVILNSSRLRQAATTPKSLSQTVQKASHQIPSDSLLQKSDG